MTVSRLTSRSHIEAVEPLENYYILGAAAEPTATPSITRTSDSAEVTPTVYVTDYSSSTPTSTSSYSIPTSYIVNHDHGYVPQELIAWMAKDPNIAAQYPGLGSCLPGGISNLIYSYH